MTITEEHKLTTKQRLLLDRLGESTEPVRVVGWHVFYQGPILVFSTGARYIVTRDGGLERM